MVGVFVGLALTTRKRHSVIGCRDNGSVVEFARVLQLLENFAEMIVVVLDLDRVVEHVVADRFVVWPICWDVVDVGELLPHPLTDSVFVAAMRLGGSVPKYLQLCRCLSVLEEIAKVAGVVVVGNRFARRFGGFACVAFAGDLPWLTFGVIRKTQFSSIHSHRRPAMSMSRKP